MQEILVHPDYSILFRGLELKATEILYSVKELQRHMWNDAKGAFDEAWGSASYVLDTVAEYKRLADIPNGFEGKDLKSVVEDSDSYIKKANDLIGPFLNSPLYERILIDLKESLDSGYLIISEALDRLLESEEPSSVADYISFRASALFKAREMMEKRVYGNIHDEGISGYHHAMDFARRMEAECLNEIDKINNP